MKIALIDKAPSKNRYSDYFKFDFDEFHMSSVPIPKLLKKDVDLEFDHSEYDFVILVGSEAAKEYAKVTSVTDFAGQLMHDKFICITNPAMLHFKPEGKPAFEKSVSRLHSYLEGKIINSSITGDFKGIDNYEEAREFLLEVIQHANGYVAVDTETTALYVRNGYVIGVPLSYKAYHGRYISADVLDGENLVFLQQILDTNYVIFHNMKFDYRMMNYHLGITFNDSKVHDTMVMHYVLDENEGHGLKELALKHTDYGDYDAELDAFKKQYCSLHNISVSEFTYDLIPFDIISKYAAIDTAVTFELFFKFWPIVQKNPKLLKVYSELLIPGTLFLMNMEEVGIPIDKYRMQQAEVYLDTWINQAKADIYSFKEVTLLEEDQGDRFNPASVPQLRKLLFDYAGLSPTGKLTATGAVSTDSEVLEELSENHALPRAILKVRQLSKMKSTYISKILPELDADDRIRTNFNLIFTTSGRLSSSGKFNAQQIPRDDPLIKGCIKAPPGYKIVSQDLQTAEMFYAAVLSGDKNLQKVFIDGGDFHSTIAKMVFDLVCKVEDVKKLFGSMRQSAKAISFGINLQRSH